MGFELISGPELTPVLNAPSRIGPFTNGVWSGSVSVSEPAADVRLAAKDELGYEGTSSAFDVLSRNDVSLEVSALSQVLPLGEEGIFELRVSNCGPAEALGLIVTSTLPAHVEVRHLAASQGTSRMEGQIARFDLGALPAGCTATATVAVLPAAARCITNTATVSRSSPDAWPANNTAMASLPVLPLVTISDLQLEEGNAGYSDVIWPVTLSAPTDQEISVGCSDGGGTARAGLDYSIAPGRLVFPPGTVSNGFRVQVIGDRQTELDEYFRLKLVSETNAMLGRTEARCTIVNDDGLAAEAESFVFGPVLSPQDVARGFPVTIRARDANWQVATNFNGMASLVARRSAPRTILDSGTTQTGFPVGTGSCALRSQVLYSDLGAAGRITSLSLNLTQMPGQILSNWTVRLKHTVLNEFPPEPEWDWKDWTVVCQTNWLPTQMGLGWVTCAFTAPFDYNGHDNLVVDFSFQNTSPSYGGLCVATPADGRRALAAAAGAEWGSPLAWTGTAPAPNIQPLVPNLRLGFDDDLSSALEPAMAGPFAQGTWTGTVTVLEPGTNLVLWAEDGRSHFGRSAPFEVKISNDLALTMVAEPESVRSGEIVRCILTVTNAAPSISSQVVLTNFLPTPARLVSAAASQGQFTVSADQIRFDLGGLRPQGSATAAVEIVTGTDGVFTNRAVVARAESEAYLGNNSAEIVLAVGPPCVIVDDKQVMEGNDGPGELSIRVALSGASLKPVRVRLNVWGEQASLFEDFMPMAADLLFLPGELETNVVLRILGDGSYEADETLRVYAWNTTADYCSDEATITILNDDPMPRLKLQHAAVVEGEAGRLTNAQFALELSTASGLPVFIEYSTADGTALAGRDYLPAAGCLELRPGTRAGLISIPVFGDMLVEPEENFRLRLDRVTNAAPESLTAECIVLNDDGAPEDLAGFAWSTVPSPQYTGQLFAVGLAARDVSGKVISNFTGAVSLCGIADEAWTTSVGAASQWQSLPLGVSYYDVRAQVICRADEIGRAGTVLSLALNVVEPENGFLTNFTLRVKHTALREYGAAPAWEDANWLVVFQEDLHLTTSGWTRFPFATPFEYDGTNSLMVDFSYNGAGGIPYGYCMATQLDWPSVLWASTYEDAGDPLSWSGAGPQANLDFVRPNLELEMARQTVVPLWPSVTANFIAGQWIDNVMVTAPSAELVLVAEDAQGHTGVSAPLAVESASDSDHDGLPDAWERRLFGSVTAASGGGDPDADGVDNRREFLAGTDPLDPASRLCILGVEPQGGATIRLTFPTVPGHRYQVEAANDLAVASWLPVSEACLGTGGILAVDIGTGQDQLKHYYRVALLP